MTMNNRVICDVIWDLTILSIIQFYLSVSLLNVVRRRTEPSV
jgi:hypothetical protein